ncbi:Eukaryotic elongation factor-2 kinase, partial [Cichlidogyrus casuarinus]
MACSHNLNAEILGQVHHELARLHQSGRFVKEAEENADLKINWEAVLFHEDCAAQLQCLDATLALAHFHLGMDFDGPLSDCPIN